MVVPLRAKAFPLHYQFSLPEVGVKVGFKDGDADGFILGKFFGSKQQALTTTSKNIAKVSKKTLSFQPMQFSHGINNFCRFVTA